jgi:hypothetical protein
MRSGSEEIFTWLGLFILAGVAFFLVALALSAFFIPQLRLLHALQAMIYLAVIVLALKASPWGFGAGVAIAAVWNGMSLFVTHLFQAGVEQFLSLARTGHVNRPDTLMVMIGGLGHFLLIIGCMTAFLQQRPGRRQWTQFFGGGLWSLAYFALIVVTVAPR